MNLCTFDNGKTCSVVEELRAKVSRDNRELLDRAAEEIEDLDRNLLAAYKRIEELEHDIRMLLALLSVPKGDGGIKKMGGYLTVDELVIEEGRQ